MAAYNLLYRNDPSGQDGADFKLAWIDSSRYDRLPEGLSLFAGVDLAIGTRCRCEAHAGDSRLAPLARLKQDWFKKQ